MTRTASIIIVLLIFGTYIWQIDQDKFARYIFFFFPVSLVILLISNKVNRALEFKTSLRAKFIRDWLTPILIFALAIVVLNQY
ncbi:hypothetical protein [Chitinivorax sp. B]|uniref:hypothetical protein n=1 Tax=Chitinivorax sp. B TaxID=2502235 RepID=UPI0020175847|nr:hypothetical protein [Chitinivorax sp. B]